MAKTWIIILVSMNEYSPYILNVEVLLHISLNDQYIVDFYDSLFQGSFYFGEREYGDVKIPGFDASPDLHTLEKRHKIVLFFT